MKSISNLSVSGAPPSPETLRRARLRAKGVSDAMAGVLSVLVFGEPRNGWASHVAAPIVEAR